MTSRIPEPASDLEAEGIPDTGDALAGKEATGDAQEGFAVPRDVETATDEYGTTGTEMAAGEPLSMRVGREEPEVLNEAAIAEGADESADASEPFPEGERGDGVGRLVEPDEGARTDDEPDAIARDARTDVGGYSAEEAAMHVEPEA
jgi:hypothetical protein